jgi:hypothetical protein
VTNQLIAINISYRDSKKLLMKISCRIEMCSVDLNNLFFKKNVNYFEESFGLLEFYLYRIELFFYNKSGVE